MRVKGQPSGFILVFSLWVLSFLTVLAVSVAAGIKQKIILADKLDQRSRMRHLLDAAAAKTKVYVRAQNALSPGGYSLTFKVNCHNNPENFAQISLGRDQASVSYTLFDQGLATEVFGVVDEERKINLNTVGLITLQRLLERVLGLQSDDANKLAQAIMDWRQWGDSQVAGFSSDEYYRNLQHPYKKKETAYEVPEELLLVQGITKDIYERLLPYVTIYGNGQVNINTVQAPVLFALGLDDQVAEKILSVRRGKDGMEGTSDDYVFGKTFDVAAEVHAMMRLEPAEARAIDGLNVLGLLTIHSSFFRAHLHAALGGSPWSKEARMVFSAGSGKIVYWREK